jgi:hypothetical protein
MIRSPPLEIHKWPVIKFSHRYLKMKDGFEQSTLLDVIPVKLENLSIRFLEYDTAYVDEAGNTGHYPLPEKGNYMILVLQNHNIDYDGVMWTTIRSQWGKSGNKLEYYRGLIGQVVECKIIE